MMIHDSDASAMAELWLDHVAAAMKNMSMMFASDVILGSEASQYLDDAM
ncbi:MAG: hypothetical protein ABF747_03460 [Bifidobacterium sp.]|uniref:Uncharacterized protein n=1 Tax=Bifidobacterium fermentum TaxID=3059035 RepID=A0AB39UGY9_9BIFI